MGASRRTLNHFNKSEDVAPHTELRELMAALHSEHTITMLQQLRKGSMRYMKWAEGIKPRTVARRVVGLRKLGIVELRETRDGKRKVKEYGLTPMGIDLLGFLDRFEKDRTETAVKEMAAQKPKGS
jgi:DNA-binding HxlR family transcriptional regulator